MHDVGWQMGHNPWQYPFRNRGLCPYFPPGSTLVFDNGCFRQCGKALSVPKQQAVHPNCSGSTNDSRESRLKDVLQLPDRPKQG